MHGSHKLCLDCCLLTTAANVFPVFWSRDKCWTCFLLLKQLEGTGSLSLVLFLTLVLHLPLWSSNTVFITLLWNKVVNLILFNITYIVYKWLVFISHDGQFLLLIEAGNPRRSHYISVQSYCFVYVLVDLQFIQRCVLSKTGLVCTKYFEDSYMNDLRNCVVWHRGHPVTPNTFMLTEKYFIQNCRYLSGNSNSLRWE